ncbi:MAG: four helix bundle protein [Opitutaceae bacterium]
MQGGFGNLTVWKEAKALAVEVYQLTRELRDLGLRDQIRRSAVSVPSNIAEGDERGTDRDSVRFLYIAKGSLAELRTQLIIGREVGAIESIAALRLEKQCAELGRSLGALIRHRLCATGEGRNARG